MRCNQFKEIGSDQRKDSSTFDKNRNNVSVSYTSVASPTKSSVSMLSSPEVIHGNAQQLVENLNNKRKQDAEIIGHFKKALETHVRIHNCIWMC